MVTRDQVAWAKPDPDLFLAAADLLGVDVTRTMIVGDSTWDMLAARRAGGLGVGVLTGGYAREELERASAFRVYERPGRPVAAHRRARRAEHLTTPTGDPKLFAGERNLTAGGA
jgi:phosphoglycolate phosphatase-like HAD superfamily hydrolase